MKNESPQQKWLESLPDHMLDILADEGSEQAWLIMEKRREAYARTPKEDYAV